MYYPNNYQKRRYTPKNVRPHRRQQRTSRGPSRPQDYRRFRNPEKSQVFVEEPSSDEEDKYEEDDDQEEYFSFDLSNNRNKYHQSRNYEYDYSNDEDDSFYSDDEEEFSYSDDEEQIEFDEDRFAAFSEGEDEEVYIVDLNDELENEAVELLDRGATVYDLNDDLVRYYDDESSDEDSDSAASSDSDQELEILVDSDLESESDSSLSDIEVELYSDSELESENEVFNIYEIDRNTGEVLLILPAESSSDSETDSHSESELDVSDEEELVDQLLVENVRQNFDEYLNSEDEIQLSEDEESQLGSEPEYFEVDSALSSSDEEEDDDSEVDFFEIVEGSDSSSSEDGYTIYEHHEESDSSSDEELLAYDSDDESDSDIEGEYLLEDKDSDDEVVVIDLSEDLANSKDCELVELENEYKLTLRFPSLVKDELKINFNKNENELILSGKLNFQDVQTDDEDLEAEVVLEEESELESSDKPSSSSSSSSDSSSESSSDSSSDSSSESSGSESDSDSEDSDSSESSDSDDSSDEEIEEDAQTLIKDYSNQEIRFEKHFQFEKLIKHDEIVAKFINDDEVELVIPHNGAYEKENLIPISVENLSSATASISSEEHNSDAEVASKPNSEATEEVDAATEDVEMA